MKKILCFIVFSSFILPLSVIADDVSSRTNDYFQKTQSMINSHVFLQEGGAEKMQEYSTNLDFQSRQSLYEDNKKRRAFAWFSMAAPSVGNWIVGDSVGGVINIVGSAAGLTAYIVGDTILNIGAINNNNQTALDGAIVMIAGLVTYFGFNVYGTISAFSYADYYNDNLKACLGISYNDSFKPVNLTALDNMNNIKAQELFYITLVSYSF